MSRSLIDSGVTPAVPPITSTSAAAGTDSTRSVPIFSACAAMLPANPAANAAMPRCRHGEPGRLAARMSERRIETEQDVVLPGLVTGEIRAGRRTLVQEVEIDLDDAFDIAHEVVGRRQAEAVHVDALVHGVGARQVTG